MNNITAPGRKEINHHIALFQKQFDLLKQFKIPAIESWVINWKFVNKLGASGSWESKVPFTKLYKDKNLPAVYFFSTTDMCSQDLYNAFVQCKSDCSKIRTGHGVKHIDYYNLAHVPKTFRNTNCLYAGSVKKDLFGGLIGHPGFGANRTGALFLNRILQKIKFDGDIQFNYFLLEPKYKPITEHIERIFQDHLKPLIGRKSLGNIKNS